MYARNAYFRVKSLDKGTEFAVALENEILPILRKQPGYKGEIMLANPGSMERIAISLWEDRSCAEAYNVNAYPQVLKILSRVVESGPKIRTYETLALHLNGGNTTEGINLNSLLLA